jgi:hypothetical protein
MATTKKTANKTTAKRTATKKAAKKPAAKKAAATNGQSVDYLHDIGVTAGDVWHQLEADGTMSVAALVRKSTASRDTVMQAVGWLAREGKVTLDGDRTRQISLR